MTCPLTLNGGTAQEQATYDLWNTNGATALIDGDGNTNNPRAYLNYILYDQDFNYVDAGFTQVSNTADTHQQLTLAKKINSGGFIYVYLSNESAANHNVYFDDFRITHQKGSILQEDHYYPFGMNISALSSTAPLAKPNRYKYNGNEEQLDFDWNIYDFNARLYDAQIGRFGAVDPMADAVHQMPWNPYHFSYNNPANLSDPSGLDAEARAGRRARRRARRDIESIYSDYSLESDGACDPWDPCYNPVEAEAAEKNTKTGKQGMNRLFKGLSKTFKASFLDFLTLTDANDAYVIATWIAGNAENIDGQSAEFLDKYFAVVGALVPAVSGSAIKKAFLEITGQLKSKADEVAETSVGSIRNANPSKSMFNCANCAIATDAILAGRPASALPSGSTRLNVIEHFFGKKFIRKLDIDQVKRMVPNHGDRGIVLGYRGPGQDGHVFNVVNQNGVIRFLDGQVGRSANLTDGYISFGLLRTN